MLATKATHLLRVSQGPEAATAVGLSEPRHDRIDVAEVSLLGLSPADNVMVCFLVVTLLPTGNFASSGALQDLCSLREWCARPWP